MTRRVKGADIAETPETEEAPKAPDLTRERTAIVKAAHVEAKRAAEEAPKLAAQARKEAQRDHADAAKELNARAEALAARAATLPDVAVENVTGTRIDIEGAVIATFSTGHKLRLPKGGDLQVLTGPGTLQNEELLDLED